MESGAGTEGDLRKQAVDRLKKKQDFKVHLLVYLLVNAFLVVIWAVSRDDGDLFWPIFVIVGWGIGVVANAWDVYGRRPITEEQIQREQDRLRG